MTRIIDTDFAVVEQRVVAEFTGLLPLCPPPRDLERALVDYMAAAKVGSKEMEVGNRLFSRLTAPAQHRVRFAVAARRAA